MTESVSIQLSDAAQTTCAGASLAETLYHQQITIFLTGELGSGKTTFLQGFFAALGVSDSVTSPTYALEQRYQSDHEEIVHVDLYRLTPAQADELIASTDDHPGIRCIEWADRLSEPIEHGIHINLEESASGRQLTVEYSDMAIPTETDIRDWRQEVLLPRHIAEHCDAVAGLTVSLCDHLHQKARLTRPLALKRAAEVHDLLRFVDFTKQAADFPDTTEDQERTWQVWRDRFTGIKHEPACAELLSERGYPEIGSIVAVHGLHLPLPERRTIEQKLLYYADKRVKFDQIVTLDERFADFAKRYGQGRASTEGKFWLEEAKKIEKRLFD